MKQSRSYNLDDIKRWHDLSPIHISNLVKSISEYLDKNNISQISLLDIGSNTGKFTELLGNEVKIVDAILVEPEVQLLEFSKDVLGESYHYENHALGSVSESVTFSPALVSDTSEINLGVGRLVGSLDKSDNSVDVIPFDLLWRKKYRDFTPDVIKIDAEGYDIEILVGMQKFLSSLKNKPLIIYEFAGCNVTNEEMKNISERLSFLKDMGYSPVWSESWTPSCSCDVALSVIPEVRKIEQKPSVSLTDTNIDSDMTIVTGLFDLGRGDIDASFSRSFEHYVESFKELLKVELPFVIYTTQEIADNVVWKIRDKSNTNVIIKSLSDIGEEFPFKHLVDQIRNNEEWKNQAEWLKNSPQSKLEMYNPVVMYKQFWLNDAALYNHFNTEYFLWVDAGISNTIGDPSQHIHPMFANKVAKHMNKMLYVCFPYDGQNEVHGFKKEGMNSYAGSDTKYVARGGIFGGSRYFINEINTKYYGLLESTLSDGYMGTEESIFTILTYREKHLTTKRMIDSNGLVIKFLNDINSVEDINTNSEQLAVYVLTYNLPKQFKLWVDSFKKAYPSDYATTKKYVINNSTDATVTNEYNKLFKEHGFEEFKFDNIGICDGRQHAAEHFSESGHEYMVFFEDDMLLHEKEGRCKNGFTTHQPNLFNKCMNIIDENELGYLKLSFSEFFGDNHDNWASYNVPEKNGVKYFPERDDGVSRRKVKIDYTGVHAGLSYSVGFYHYCNWPLMFNKEGNKKVFLDTVYEHKYEQTWMSHVMNMQWDSKIKVGCLLASPINHSRVHHYEKDSRRENKHYTN